MSDSAHLRMSIWRPRLCLFHACSSSAMATCHPCLLTQRCVVHISTVRLTYRRNANCILMKEAWKTAAVICSSYSSTYWLQPHSVTMFVITRDRIAWVPAQEPCVTGLACALGISIFKLFRVRLGGSQSREDREKENLKAHCYCMVAT